MPHPLVEQLRFARSELWRALEGVSEEDAVRRLLPMNCISWSVGHLAWQEQRNWLYRGQGRLLLPEVNERFASGGPGSAPALAEVRSAWWEITAAADPWLDALTAERLAVPPEHGPGGQRIPFTIGSLLLRTTYHTGTTSGRTWRSGRCSGIGACPNLLGTWTMRRRTARRRVGPG